MMTNKFKVGDLVLLREDSKYNDNQKSNPLGVRGVITLVNYNRYFTIEVRWDNGFCNVYREEDLKHYEEEDMGFKLADGSVHTDYQVGDTFIRTHDGIIDKGTVVTVTSEDFHTSCPLVEHGHGKSTYSSWGYLTPAGKTLHKVRQRKGFKPSDLKDGMVVTLRDGRQGIVFGGKIESMFDDIRTETKSNTIAHITHYRSDLTVNSIFGSFDIMKVSYMGSVLWEREEDTKQKELEELYRQIDELKQKADKIKGG